MQECTGRSATAGVHFQECICRSALPGVQLQECIGRSAMAGVHWQKCICRSALAGGHQLLPWRKGPEHPPPFEPTCPPRNHLLRTL